MVANKRLPDSNTIVPKVLQGHSPICCLEGGNRHFSNRTLVESIRSLLRYNLQQIRITFSCNYVAWADQLSTGSEVQGSIRIFDEIAVRSKEGHLVRQILAHAEPTACHLDRRLDDIGPRKACILLVKILQSTKLYGDTAFVALNVPRRESQASGVSSPGQPSTLGRWDVSFEHILEGGGRSGLPEIDEFVGAVGGASEEEAAASKATDVGTYLQVRPGSETRRQIRKPMTPMQN